MRRLNSASKQDSPTGTSSASRRASSKRHAALVRSCKDLLAARKIPHWQINTMGVPLANGGFRPSPCVGVSDILAVLPPSGRMLAVECKTGTGRLTPAQQKFLSEVERSGGIACVARDVLDVERVISRPGESC